MAVPDEEERFIKLCKLIERERYENLADTIEAQILQAIINLESEIAGGLIEAQKIGDKINEGQPAKFHRKQAGITRICKKMGFKTKRPKGKTHIEVDPRLLNKLAERYLHENAQNAHPAKSEEGKRDSECISSAKTLDGHEKCANGARKVRRVPYGNYKKNADGAESSETQEVLPLKE